jgi:hypothetical protein
MGLGRYDAVGQRLRVHADAWLKRLALVALVPLLAAWYPGGEPEFFAWTEPTTRVDGSPLAPAAEISAYILRCTKDGADAFTRTVGVGGQNRWNVAQGTFTEGTWVCALYARDQEARTSDPSAAVEFLVQTYKFVVAPSAPAGLAVG